MKFGIENLKLLLSVIFSFVTTGDKMGHETSWPARMTHLFGFFPSLMILSAIKWDLLDDEVKDVDDVERVELIKFIKEKFDIVDDKLEAVLEEGLTLAANIGSMVKTVIGFIERVKEFFKK
jgi:hypothetical protein